MNFGEKLTNLRKQKGLSQEELGEKLDVTRQTISKWELGQTSPDTAKLTEIANFFEVGVNELTNEEEIKLEGDAIKNTEEKKKTPAGIIILIIVLVVALLGVVYFITTSIINGITNGAKKVVDSGVEMQKKAAGTFIDAVEKAKDSWENAKDSWEDEIKDNTNKIVQQYDELKEKTLDKFEKETKEMEEKSAEKFEQKRKEFEQKFEEETQKMKEAYNEEIKKMQGGN